MRWPMLGAALAVIVAGAYVVLRGRAAPLPDPPEPRLSGEVDPGCVARIRDAVAAVRADRSARERWIELAMVYQAHGLYALARPCYETALSMNDDDAVAWYHLATIRAHDGDVAGAIEAVRRSIAVDGTYAPAHRRLGEWLLDLDDQAGALASFERARDLLPADPAIHVGIARVALRAGDPERAAAILEGNGGDSGAALHLSAAIARRLGRAADADALVARAARATGRPIDPWSDALGRFNATNEAQLGRARALAEAGLTDAALRLLHELARTYPDHAGVHNAAGIVLVQAGRHADAHAAFTRAVAAAAEFAEAHANLAMTSVALADAGAPPAQRDALVAAAERHVARAIELDPAYAPARALDADLLHRRGRDGAAVARYREALALMPAPPWALAAGRILVETGAFADALPLLEGAARDMPGSVEARLALAEACAGLGRGAEASALIGAATKQWPDDPRPRDLARRLGLEDPE
jgi:tetratricopeptide (TPR) repeat protein